MGLGDTSGGFSASLHSLTNSTSILGQDEPPKILRSSTWPQACYRELIELSVQLPRVITLLEVGTLVNCKLSILENYTGHVIARDLNYVTGNISASSI